MKDIIARWEKLKADADECAMIRNTSIDPDKRELFALLSEKLGLLVSAAERLITAREGGSTISYVTTNDQSLLISRPFKTRVRK